MKKKIADLPALLEYAHSVGGFSVVPTEEGAAKGKAMQALKGQTQMQLDIILEQMRLLAKQVREIQDRVQISHEVYQAQMNFQPCIGNSYYLYRKKDGVPVLSLISPEEWGDKLGFDCFLAEVELLADHTWKVIRESDENQNS